MFELLLLCKHDNSKVDLILQLDVYAFEKNKGGF